MSARAASPRRPDRGGVPVRLAAVVALVVFSVLASTSAGWAFWTTQLHATGGATRATLTVTTANVGSLDYVFMNNTLTTTGSITVTNTTATSSTTAGAVTLSIGQAAASVLGTKVSVTIWPTTAPSGCTPTAAVGAGAITAVWSVGLTTGFSLAPGASSSYCARSFVTDGKRTSVGSAGGTQSFTPRVQATMTVGSFTASATATATEKTQAMYVPIALTTGVPFWLRPNWGNAQYDYCLDISQANAAPGGFAISYGCKTYGSTNQMFSFVQTGDNLYQIVPRHAPSLVLDTDGSQTSGTGISTRTGSAPTSGDDSQRWQAQDIGNGYIQLMNVDSLLCLSAPNGVNQNNGPLTQAPCADAPGQQWTLSRTVENDTATVTGDGTPTATIAYGWSSIPNGPYRVQLSKGGAWVDVATSASGPTGVSVTAAALNAANGNATGANLSLRFVDSFSTRVAIGVVSFTRSGQNYAVSTATISDLQ